MQTHPLASITLIVTTFILLLSPLISGAPAPAPGPNPNPNPNPVLVERICQVAQPGQPCTNIDGVPSCNNDYLSILYCVSPGVWQLGHQCGNLELCQCTDGIPNCG